MTAPTRAQIEALIGEYRTTMDVHVLHSWAADAIKLLRALTPAEPQPAPVEPVAHAYVVDDECEGIQWGLDIDLPDDPALVLLYPPRAAQTTPPEDAGALRADADRYRWMRDCAAKDGADLDTFVDSARAALAKQGGA